MYLTDGVNSGWVKLSCPNRLFGSGEEVIPQEEKLDPIETCGFLPVPKYGKYDPACATKLMKVGDVCPLVCNVPGPRTVPAQDMWNLFSGEQHTKCARRAGEPAEFHQSFCRPTSESLMIHAYSDEVCDGGIMIDAMPLDTDIHFSKGVHHFTCKGATVQYKGDHEGLKKLAPVTSGDCIDGSSFGKVAVRLSCPGFRFIQSVEGPTK